MKTITSLITISLVISFSTSVTAQEYGASSPTTLTGVITLEQLLDVPGWFGSEFTEYMPERAYIDGLKENFEDVTIVAVFGTWSENSKREIPRLLRVLQSLNVDPNILTMIGVDQNLRSPTGEERQYDIKKVPTIIVFRNGAEFGRIVESTIGPLEKDMLGFFYAQAPSQPMPTGIDAGELPPTPETPPSPEDPHHPPAPPKPEPPKK